MQMFNNLMFHHKEIKIFNNKTYNNKETLLVNNLISNNKEINFLHKMQFQLQILIFQIIH